MRRCPGHGRGQAKSRTSRTDNPSRPVSTGIGSAPLTKDRPAAAWGASAERHNPIHSPVQDAISVAIITEAYEVSDAYQASARELSSADPPPPGLMTISTRNRTREQRRSAELRSPDSGASRAQRARLRRTANGRHSCLGRPPWLPGQTSRVPPARPWDRIRQHRPTSLGWAMAESTSRAAIDAGFMGSTLGRFWRWRRRAAALPPNRSAAAG